MKTILTAIILTMTAITAQAQETSITVSFGQNLKFTNGNKVFRKLRITFTFKEGKEHIPIHGHGEEPTTGVKLPMTGTCTASPVSPGYSAYYEMIRIWPGNIDKVLSCTAHGTIFDYQLVIDTDEQSPLYGTGTATIWRKDRATYGNEIGEGDLHIIGTDL